MLLLLLLRSRRNYAGNRSWPSAAGRSWSNVLKTWYFVTNSAIWQAVSIGLLKISGSSSVVLIKFLGRDLAARLGSATRLSKAVNTTPQVLCPFWWVEVTELSGVRSGYWAPDFRGSSRCFIDLTLFDSQFFLSRRYLMSWRGLDITP